jgi:hypothetical protein
MSDSTHEGFFVKKIVEPPPCLPLAPRGNYPTTDRTPPGRPTDRHRRAAALLTSQEPADLAPRHVWT